MLAMIGRVSEHLRVSMSSNWSKSWAIFAWVRMMRQLVQMEEMLELI